MNLTSTFNDLPVLIRVQTYSTSVPFPGSNTSDEIDSNQRIQLRLVQSDHRGGFCDCWAVTHLNVTNITTSEVDPISLR